MPAGTQDREPKGGAALCAWENRIFALKGNRTTEFYTYDVASTAWQRLADLPSKRVKDGACLASLDGVIFATVGGNKMEFYAYDMLTNTWTRLEDVPRDPDRRKVKYGAAMATIDGMVLFLKGRKTEVLFAYEPDLELFRSQGTPVEGGVAAEPVVAQPEVVVAPNPAGRYVRISYSTELAGPVHGRLFSSSGRLVREFSDGRGEITLDVSSLANGVYLVSLRAGNSVVNTRLVIQR